MPDPARILIVDDEPEVRAVIADTLVSSGYVVSQAPDTSAALAMLAEARPDVILLDIRMPGIDGVQALPDFRARAPDVPVIMLTANPDAEMARATLRLGAFDYIAKPYDLERLREVVAAALLHGGPG